MWRSFALRLEEQMPLGSYYRGYECVLLEYTPGAIQCQGCYMQASIPKSVPGALTVATLPPPRQEIMTPKLQGTAA